jgi:hypothetical protein
VNSEYAVTRIRRSEFGIYFLLMFIDYLLILIGAVSRSGRGILVPRAGVPEPSVTKAQNACPWLSALGFRKHGQRIKWSA